MNPITIHCSCCKSSEARILHSGLRSVYTEKPYDVVECLACTNGITSPEVSAAELQKIYSGTYLYPVHLLALGEKKYRARSMAKRIRQKAPASSHPKILEVGCMFGYLLNELKSDYIVSGIDIGADAVNYCRQQGLNVSDISIEKFIDTSDEKFDVIIISHVLEHLLHPDEVLSRLRKHLNPGGKIFILVPNYLSIQAKLFGRYWGWWQVPVHINHFNKKSLSSLAEQNGFLKKSEALCGGDSLMLLLNLVNLFGIQNKNAAPGFIQRTVIRFFTTFFRYWYKFGNEELIMELEIAGKD